MSDHRNESEQAMFEHLSKSICELAHEVCENRKQRATDFDWYKSHADLAKKHDLDQMEKRLTDAIAKSASIPSSVETAAIRLGSKLDKLDASIPDK